MASACALAMFSGKIIFISRLSRPAGRSKRIFTGGVVKGHGICSAAVCESAALRVGARSPERPDFPRPGEDVTAGDKKGNLSRSD